MTFLSPVLYIQDYSSSVSNGLTSISELIMDFLWVPPVYVTWKFKPPHCTPMSVKSEKETGTRTKSRIKNLWDSKIKCDRWNIMPFSRDKDTSWGVGNIILKESSLVVSIWKREIINSVPQIASCVSTMLNANLSSSNSVEELTVEQYLTQQCDVLIKVRVSQRNEFCNESHVLLNEILFFCQSV